MKVGRDLLGMKAQEQWMESVLLLESKATKEKINRAG